MRLAWMLSFNTAQENKCVFLKKKLFLQVQIKCIFSHTKKVNTEPMCTGRAIKDIVLWASDYACFCCSLRNNKAKTQQVRQWKYTETWWIKNWVIFLTIGLVLGTDWAFFKVSSVWQQTFRAGRWLHFDWGWMLNHVCCRFKLTMVKWYTF